MKRRIYQVLLDWKNNLNRKPFMLLGARQVGKTYVIEEFCKNEFEHVISINLFEREDIVQLYNENYTSQEKFIKLKALLQFDIETPNTILFIDEIQESEQLISELKYFCEKHNSIYIICAGSLLGVKLKRSHFSFPVGKVWMETMYPMNFHEYLIACHEELLIQEIRKCYTNNTQMNDSLHHKALELYKTYLICGGMPESVKNMIDSGFDITKYNQNILDNILDSYFNDMNKYVSSNSESLKIERAYRSIPFQLNNQSKKFQFSKISNGGKARDYELPLDWLLSSNIVLQSFQVSTPSIPLKGFVKDNFFKLFLSDVGILCRLAEINYTDIIMENLSLFKGVIAENFVATELTTLGYSLYYWKNDATSEVDFLLYKDSTIIPIEVKAGDNVQSKSLDVYCQTYQPNISYRISTRNFGYDEKKKLKSIPLYAVFCLKD